jgi:GT2 family glycosyltransferase
VSVVIVTRDRRDELATTLTHLLALPERPPILVLDNGSSDGTPDLARSFGPRVEVVELGENLGSAARNVGVSRARTPLVAFSDDDSWWAPGSLQRASDLFDRHPRLALLAARILVGPEHRLDPVCSEMADSPLPVEHDLPGRSVLGFVACGAVVRRSMYLVAGGFPARYGIGGEETPLAVELASRGWGLAYVDSVLALHHPSVSRNPERRRAVQHRNALWSSWRHERAVPAARRTLTALRSSVNDAALRHGTLEALRQAPAVLAERRLPPRAVTQDLESLATGS